MLPCLDSVLWQKAFSYHYLRSRCAEAARARWLALSFATGGSRRPLAAEDGRLDLKLDIAGIDQCGTREVPAARGTGLHDDRS